MVSSQRVYERCGELRARFTGVWCDHAAPHALSGLVLMLLGTMAYDGDVTHLDVSALRGLFDQPGCATAVLCQSSPLRTGQCHWPSSSDARVSARVRSESGPRDSVCKKKLALPRTRTPTWLAEHTETETVAVALRHTSVSLRLSNRTAVDVNRLQRVREHQNITLRILWAARGTQPSFGWQPSRLATVPLPRVLA